MEIQQKNYVQKSNSTLGGLDLWTNAIHLATTIDI